MKKFKNKYHNNKTKVDGIIFDSRKEADRWFQLQFLLKANKISDLKRQVKFELIKTHYYGKECIRGCSYIADFVYFEDGVKVVEDTKGYKTPEYKIKKKIFLEKYVLNGDVVFLENGKTPVYYKITEK